eukprot:768581-Hanusia_phi.AAC.1
MLGTTKLPDCFISWRTCWQIRGGRKGKEHEGVEKSSRNRKEAGKEGEGMGQAPVQQLQRPWRTCPGREHEKGASTQEDVEKLTQ